MMMGRGKCNLKLLTEIDQLSLFVCGREFFVKDDVFKNPILSLRELQVENGTFCFSAVKRFLFSVRFQDCIKKSKVDLKILTLELPRSQNVPFTVWYTYSFAAK